jgi:hypothetical protein
MRLIMTFKAAVLAATGLLFSVSAAMAAPELTPEIEQKIKDMLTAQGYEVGKIKVEDDSYEAYAKKNGGKFEIYFNEKLEIVKTSEED